jgi:hypothetical protein
VRAWQAASPGCQRLLVANGDIIWPAAARKVHEAGDGVLTRSPVPSFKVGGDWRGPRLAALSLKQPPSVPFPGYSQATGPCCCWIGG